MGIEYTYKHAYFLLIGLQMDTSTYVGAVHNKFKWPMSRETQAIGHVFNLLVSLFDQSKGKKTFFPFPYEIEDKNAKKETVGEKFIPKKEKNNIFQQMNSEFKEKD